MRAGWILAAVALGGCSIVWAPNRDAIAPDLDGGFDAAIDAGDAAAMDAGDAGDGGDVDGCTRTETTESTCVGGGDEDCDGRVDCFDSDCSGSDDCCGTGGVWAPASDYSSTEWEPIPRTNPTGILRPGMGVISSFGLTGGPRALLYERECAPVALGLDLSVDFVIDPSCAGCDHFAALALTPADDMVEGNRLLSEVAVVVTGQGDVWVERAGSIVTTPDTRRTGLIPGPTIHAALRLRPGVDDAGRAVMLATVTVEQVGGLDETLLENEPLLIQEDLRGEGFCPTPYDGVRGLLLALEGDGDGVRVTSLAQGSQRQCSNPSFFEDLGLQGFESAFDDCGGAQLGEPSFVAYCRNCSSTRNPTWELWADTTDEERAENLGDYTDFYVCGANAGTLSGTWDARTDGMNRDLVPGPDPPVLPAPSMRSVREPFVWAPAELTTPGGNLIVAWSERVMERDDRHEIRVGRLDAAGDNGPILDPVTVLGVASTPECESLRDPALVPRSADMLDGFHLLFTCEGLLAAPNSIGAARLLWNTDGTALELVPGSVRMDVLSSELGAYAMRGPFAPEPVAQIDEAAGTVRLDLWFLARSAGGEVTLAFASGEGALGDELPALSAYPGNPILRADDPIFGDAPACTLGCYLNGVGVARATETRDFQIVVGRTVVGAASNTHQLIGLRQRRPL